MADIRAMDLYKAMIASGRYAPSDAVEAIEAMRDEVRDGADPCEVLEFEGFEPDYMLDTIP